MSEPQRKKQRQKKEVRLELVATMYKEGSSYREIQSEVKKKLRLDTYAIGSVHNDVQTLLAEWRKSRIDDMDDAIQLELTRIDDAIKELWKEWRKSKLSYTQKIKKTKGGALTDDDGNKTPEIDESTIYEIEQQTKQIKRYGDVSYISEIRQQLIERRKLLGLYSPEKKEITGADGTPLNPQAVNVDSLTPEEMEVLFNIAAKRDEKDKESAE